PYRIFTSRAEARLTLRHDNSDERLSPHGHRIGLLGDSDWERFNSRRDRLANLRNILDATRYKRSDVEYRTASEILGCDLGDSFTLSNLAQRQNVNADLIKQLLPNDLSVNSKNVEIESALADSLYRGYIDNQRNAAERVNHHDGLKVPDNFSFQIVNGLSHEMVERLERARPQNFGQVRKIAGLTPSALSTLLVHLTSTAKAA
ncbi:MAG: tRNA uridine-5-carboxymethylaminomethyl(34) synthesis enzyme MnmG, partial [Pyrinomonadaceae bacterium]|nr:tRNA uridine-5-carboxymethylaminomethyl(34) synthesis enzyme MnmG [Pyrinomonadaceae bacterium]